MPPVPPTPLPEAEFGAAYVRTVTPTGNPLIDGVLKEFSWLSADLSYGFPTVHDDYNSVYAGGFNDNLVPLTNLQYDAIDFWLDQYSNMSGLNFTLYDGVDGSATHAKAAVIKFSGTDDSNLDLAFGLGPSELGQGGDVWYNNSGSDPYYGTYDWDTIGHELGHSLGLSHGQIGGGGLPNVALPYQQDSKEYSIMTYTSFVGEPASGLPGSGYRIVEGHSPQSLMMSDIAALQYLYGATFTKNAGDTTYTFDILTGEMSINGVGQNKLAAEDEHNIVFRTIWDGNGSDHYDFSNYTTGMSINLNPGEYTNFDVGGVLQKADLGGRNGHPTELARGNVFNALLFEDDARSLIENATGGTGDDVIFANQTKNILDGGAGNNTVDYLSATVGVNVDLEIGKASDGSSDDQLIRIESVNGSEYNDTLRGSNAANKIWGRAGDDRIFASHGDDTLDGGDDTDTLDFSLITSGGVTANLTAGTVTGGSDTDTISGFENILGTAHADNLIGDAGKNTLLGGEGDDVIDGGLGGLNILDGGAGNNTLSYASAGADAIVDLRTNLASEGGVNDTISNFINIIGSGFNDTLTGDDRNNVIEGGGGIDVIDGGDGIDTLSYVNSANSAFVDLAAGTTFGGSNYTLTSIENVIGSSGVDSFTSNAQDNVFDGGDGNDGVVYSAATRGVSIDLITGKATGDGNDRLKSIEYATGSNFNDQLIGNAQDNILIGLDGIDTAVFAHAYAEYTIADVGGDRYTLTHTSGEIDEIRTIEKMQFSDRTVTVDNMAPTSSLIADMSSVEAGNVAAVYVAGYFDDADGDALIFSATGLPVGLQINPSTGAITGDITAAVGDYNVVITATDTSNASVINEFVWAVTATPVNTPPTSNAIADMSNEEASTVVATDMTGYFADADDDILTYSDAGLPEGLTIDSLTGVVSGDITAVAAIYAVTITATDPFGAAVDNQFSWTVTGVNTPTPPTNHAPLALTIEDVTNDEGDAVSLFDASGYFTDADSDTLTYTATGLPDGFTIDADTGVISGGTANDANIYFVTITATDGSNASASAQFEWAVNAPAIVPDIVTGEPDNDTIFNALGNVNVSGNAGHDSITVLAGINTIDGGADSDLLIGGFDADTIIGGTGNDVIRGDASDIVGGSDSLEGGADNDILMGGLGVDIFKFNTNDGNDVIGKFNADDVIFNATTGHSVSATAADFMSGIDHIELHGFSGIDASNVMGSITDIGGNAVFSAQGTEITFFGLLEDQLSANDFTFS